MKILITGGAGFIGSNFIHYILEKYPENKIVVLDKLSYAGRLENLQDIINKITFIKGDVCKKDDVKRALNDCNIVFNFAAETHVDRSIIEAGVFVKTDILGTYNLLDIARKLDIEKFIQISTDEVYGSITNDSFEETDILNPSSPYSASKAGADLLVNAYYKTYSMPVLITRSSNNYGPFQFPEKLIPVLIINALKNKLLPIYGDGKNVRDWVHVFDNCRAIDLVSKKGKFGDVFNIGSGNEKTNLEIANIIVKELNKPKKLIKFVKDRPGHDFRYSLSWKKIKKLGWEPIINLTEGLKKTIEWYVNNKWWWEPIIKNLSKF